MGKLTELLKDLEINETNTKPIRKAKYFTKVKDNVTLIKGFNQQMDILYLPTSQFGYRFLLVCVDLATNEFDIEPTKDLYASTILNAYKNMFGRGFIERAKVTIGTDGGSEFKGVFNSYLKQHNIFHRVGVPDRHQNANVESLNRTLGRLINGYLNSKEEKTGRIRKSWIGAIDKIRNKLNHIRYRKVPNDINSYVYPSFTSIVKVGRKEKNVEPKFEVGDMVFYKSEVPLTILGVKQNTKNFREGDRRWNIEAKKIVKIFYYSGKVLYRYLLEGIKNVSYTENELRLA